MRTIGVALTLLMLSTVGHADDAAPAAGASIDQPLRLVAPSLTARSPEWALAHRRKIAALALLGVGAAGIVSSVGLGFTSFVYSFCNYDCSMGSRTIDRMSSAAIGLGVVGAAAMLVAIPLYVVGKRNEQRWQLGAAPLANGGFTAMLSGHF